MKTTGLFTTQLVQYTLPKGVDSFKLIPFGDVHRDSDMHAHRKWQEFLEYSRGQKNALFLGMGDYCDGMSTSERIVINNGGLHDTTRRSIENLYKKWTKTLIDELSFMRGRIIGLLGGNHYYEFGEGSTTDHLLAEALDTRFLGVNSLIRLAIDKETDKTSVNFDIFAHHGKGGGSTAGGTFNTIEKMAATAEADLYLMGHDHKKGCVPGQTRIKLVNRPGTKSGVDIVEHTAWLGRTGSFLKAYEDGRVSYNVDAGRSACSLGWIELDLTFVRDRRNGRQHRSLNVRSTT
jgi:predicted phosphodiesterase